MSRLRYGPVTLKEANAFVGAEHRHVGRAVGHKFAIGAWIGERMVGVVIVARTTARELDAPTRAEVTRLATDGTANACSFLYQRARRVAQSMGYTSLITYTRADESGSSLRAIGATLEAELPARSWRRASVARPRVDKSEPAPRRRWELLNDFAAGPTRPVLRYHGGKWRLAPWIISHFPAHRVYAEPFGGGGSVLMRKARAYAEVYNDLDDRVVNVFRVLRNELQAKELAAALYLTPFAREEFAGTREIDSDTPHVEQARLSILRSFAGFGSASTYANYATGFRATTNRSGTTPAHDWAGYPNQISAFVDRLRGVTIEHRDAAVVIANHDAPTTLFYCDPPYVHGTRAHYAAKGRYGHAAYRHEMTDDDHRRLAEVLRSVAGFVVLSGYPSDLYDRELYADWVRHERQHLADGAKKRTEVLWLNPSCSAALRSENPQYEFHPAAALSAVEEDPAA